MRHIDRFRGCLLGLAVGDAVGTTLEFSTRDTFEPITDMVGGGPFHLAPGEWTDDTSMALCLATSLVNKGGFDPKDQMDLYCRWARDGFMSSTGDRFDIGNTVANALSKYRRTGDPFCGPVSILSAGNGSLTRLAPIPMFFFSSEHATDRYAAESSRTTHGAKECIDACRLLAQILRRALEGMPKDAVLGGSALKFEGAEKIVEIAKCSFAEKNRSAIRGTGYVVDCLEAALWCFLHTETFEAAILEAANLGDDADTTAAVCGQLAGAFYGESGIPTRWLDRLALRSLIGDLAGRLMVAGEECAVSRSD
jgi:ADP-ribosyl-[dinitrogen reductase] hydrolase